MIALISIDPSFGNCPGIYKALSKIDDVEAVFMQLDPKGFHEQIPHKIGFEHIPRVDHYYIVSSDAFMRLNLPRHKTTVILTDSYYLLNHKAINSHLEGCRVFAMADLAKYCRYDKIYYPPFEYEGEVVKNETLTIAHSPYSMTKQKEKGTDIIVEACNGYALDIIMDATWEESIERKSKAHIFIDQVSEREFGYNGVLAKSGIEAMAVGCLTMTSGDAISGKIPKPPIVSINKSNINTKINSYIYRESRRESVSRVQTEWVKEYLNYTFQSQYLA